MSLTSPTSVDVAVVGAGLAGLSAARDLTSAGLTVEVIEARPRIGGRVFTTRDPSVSVPLELGAEFVHGGAPTTRAVAREAGLTILDVAGERWESTRHGLRRFEGFWEGLDRVMRKLDAKRGPDRSFADFLAERPGGRSLARDRRLAEQWVRGFHAADPARVSARALAEGGSPGGDESEQRQGRLREGYDRIPAHLATALAREPRVGTVVTSVHWSPGEVELTLRDAAGSGATRPSLRARAVVVTVPIGVLQSPPETDGGISFTPPLPPSKTDALRGLAEGHVVRVAVVLDDRIWLGDGPRKAAHGATLDRLAFVQPGDEEMPVCWTAYPTDAPVLVAWFGGPAAAALARCADAEIESRAVQSLARRLHVGRGRFERHVRHCHLHNWSADPFSRGAYSYVLVGGTDSAAALARPVAGTLFFAGEAFDAEGRNGTVEGAIGSGRRAAKQVRRAMGG